MFWLFASVIITLAVYHKGFRKVLLWGMPAWLLIAFFTVGS
jgi:hypothetical protein